MSNLFLAGGNRRPCGWTSQLLTLLPPPRPALLPSAPQGVHLRLDIPRVVAMIAAEGLMPLANVSTAYALYTDADVMFTGRAPHADVSTCTQPLPQLVRLGPQHAHGTAENSGVLLLNVSAWGGELPAFVEYGRRKDFQFSQFDQGARVGGRGAGPHAGRLTGRSGLLLHVWRHPFVGARKEGG